MNYLYRSFTAFLISGLMSAVCHAEVSYETDIVKAPKPVQKFFVTKVLNFNREKFEMTDGLGINSLKATYVRGDGANISVSIIAQGKPASSGLFKSTYAMTELPFKNKELSKNFTFLMVDGTDIGYFTKESNEMAANAILPKSRLLQVNQDSGIVIEPDFVKFLQSFKFSVLK